MLLAPAALAGDVLCNWLGPKGAPLFAAHRPAALSDFDGDGQPDIAFADPGDSTLAPSGGAAFVRSVAGCAQIALIAGPFPNDGLSTVAGPADLDGDGLGDLVVGLPGDDSAAMNGGRVWAWRGGATPAPLWSLSGIVGHGRLGEPLAVIGDADLDGVVDVAAAAPLADAGGVAHAGRVVVLSGASGMPLLDLAGHVTGGAFGTSVAAVGDLDLDGRPDLAVGAPTEPFPSTDGVVHLLSGKDGSELGPIQGPNRFGLGVRASADLDGDGLPDLLVLSSAYYVDGSVHLVPAKGGPIVTLAVFQYATAEGFDALADVDGDGLDDLLLPGANGGLELRRGGDFALLAHLEGERATGLADLDSDGFAEYVTVRSSGFEQAANEVALISGRCDAVRPYGQGCAAPGGTAPRLAVRGPCAIAAGSSLTLEVDRAPENATALLLLGAQPVNQPVGACVLHVAPVVGVVAGLMTDAWGRSVTKLLVPPGLSGVSAHLQAFVAEPPAPAGFVGSNGLTLTFP